MQNLKTQVFKIVWSILKASMLLLQAHLVAAFEQSLGNMTIRLKSLTLTAEQKVKAASFLQNIRLATFGWPSSRYRTLSWMTWGRPSSCWRSRTLLPRPPLMGSSTRPNWCLKETRRVQTHCKHAELIFGEQTPNADSSNSLLSWEQRQSAATAEPAAWPAHQEAALLRQRQQHQQRHQPLQRGLQHGRRRQKQEEKQEELGKMRRFQTVALRCWFGVLFNMFFMCHMFGFFFFRLLSLGTRWIPTLDSFWTLSVFSAFRLKKINRQSDHNLTRKH